MVFGIEPLQQVVAAQRDHADVGVGLDGEVQPRETVGGGVAGDAGAPHAGRHAQPRQRRLQLGRQGGAGAAGQSRR